MSLTKKQATKIARAVVKQIGGTPWEPYVWENLGWHASAEWGGGYLHEGGGGLTLYIDKADRSYCVIASTPFIQGWAHETARMPVLRMAGTNDSPCRIRRRFRR